MVKRSILDDLTARTKAIQDEANGIINVMAVTRPEPQKSPAERNIDILNQYDRKKLPLPRTQGSDLDSINDQLERYLKDPLYAKNNSGEPDFESPSAPRRLFMPSHIDLQSGIGPRPQAAQPEDSLGMRDFGSGLVAPGMGQEVAQPPSTNLLGQTVGRVVGPPARMTGIGLGAVANKTIVPIWDAVGEFAQNRAGTGEELIANLNRTPEQVFSDLLTQLNTDEEGWMEFVDREGQDAADLLFAEEWLKAMGSNFIIPGNTEAERAAHANLRIGRMLEPSFEDPTITVAENMIRRGHNPADLMMIPLSIVEAAEGPVTLASRLIISQIGRQIDVMNGGDGSKGEQIGDFVGSFWASFPNNPAAGLRTVDNIGASAVTKTGRDAIMSATKGKPQSAEDLLAGLQATGRPVQSGKGIAAATGADFAASEARDVYGLAKAGLGAARNRLPIGTVDAFADPEDAAAAARGAGDVAPRKRSIKELSEAALEDGDVTWNDIGIDPKELGYGFKGDVSIASADKSTLGLNRLETRRFEFEMMLDQDANRSAAAAARRVVSTVERGLDPEFADEAIDYIGMTIGDYVGDNDNLDWAIGTAIGNYDADALLVDVLPQIRAGSERLTKEAQDGLQLLDRIDEEIKGVLIERGIAKIGAEEVTTPPTGTTAARGADDVQGVGTELLPRNQDGTVTLFHGTTPEGGRSIRESGTLIGEENGVFLTTDRDAALTFGNEIVEIKVNPARLIIDDEFPTGRQDFRIPAQVGEPVEVGITQPPTTPATGTAAGVGRPAATHFADDATVALTKSQRDDIAGSLKEAAEVLVNDQNTNLVRNNNSFDEFVRSLLNDKGQVVVPANITGSELNQYRKLAQELLDSPDSLSKQKVRSLEGFIKKIDDQGIDPVASNEQLIKDRGLNIKELESAARPKELQIDRPARATAARTTAEEDPTVNLEKISIRSTREEREAKFAASKAKTADAKLERDVASARKTVDAERSVLPTPLAYAKNAVTSTVGKFVVDESKATGNLLKFAAKIPLHPKQQTKEFFTFIKNEKVVFSGDKDTDKLFQMLIHAEDRTKIKNAAVKKERKRIAKDLADASKKMEESESAAAWEDGLRNLNTARKRRDELPSALGIPKELMIEHKSLTDWSLGSRIMGSNLSPFDKSRAMFSYLDLLNGHMITKSEVDNLTEVFGVGFRQAMNRFRKGGEKWREVIVDALGIQVSFQGSYDMSAPFRQGYFLLTRMPASGIPAMGRMIRAFADPTFAASVTADILADPLYAKFKDANLHIAKMGDITVAGQTDEVFISSIPGKIPFFGAGVRASARAYVTLLNKLRFDYMKNMYKTWDQPVQVNGKMVKPTIPKKQLELLGQLANFASGRGPGAPGVKIIDKTFIQQITQIMFYAPRLAISRFVLPAKAGFNFAAGARLPKADRALARQVMSGVEGASEKMSESEAVGILRANRQIRMESARVLVQGFGSMLAITGLVSTALKARGSEVEVETDGRSTDFGKIHHKELRWDNYAGMQPVYRVMAQLMTSQSKSTSSGKIQDKSYAAILGGFMRGKFSPSAGLAYDLTAGGGENIVGEGVLGDFTYDEEGKESLDLNIGRLAWNQLGALFIQDLVEAMKEVGMQTAGIAGVPGWFGTGTTTYPTEREIINEHLKNDIEVSNSQGERIYDMRDLSPTQLNIVMQDGTIDDEIKEMNHGRRQTDLMAISENRQLKSLARDESLIRGQNYTGNQWREDRGTASVLSANVAEVRQAIEGFEFEQDQKYGGAIGFVIEMMGGANNPDRTGEQQALFDWYELMNQYVSDPAVLKSLDVDVDNLTDEELEIVRKGIDLDGLLPARDKFLAGLPAKEMDYVLSNVSPNRTGVQDVYLRSQPLLKEYFEIPETVINSFKTSEQAKQTLLVKWDEYKGINATEKQLFLELNPAIKMVEQLVSDKEEIVRLTNRDIDDLLVTFYNSKPRHPMNEAEGQFGYAPHKIRLRVLSGADAALDERLGVSGVQRDNSLDLNDPAIAELEKVLTNK